MIQGLELSTADKWRPPIATGYTVRVRAIVNSILGPRDARAETDRHC